MIPEDQEELLKIAELAARMISKEPFSATVTSCERTAEAEAEALMERVKNFKIETVCHGFNCECGAGGAIQVKPGPIPRYCPICGKHFLADAFGELPGLKSTANG